MIQHYVLVFIWLQYGSIFEPDPHLANQHVENFVGHVPRGLLHPLRAELTSGHPKNEYVFFIVFLTLACQWLWYPRTIPNKNWVEFYIQYLFLSHQYTITWNLHNRINKPSSFFHPKLDHDQFLGDGFIQTAFGKTQGSSEQLAPWIMAAIVSEGLAWRFWLGGLNTCCNLPWPKKKM